MSDGIAHLVVVPRRPGRLIDVDDHPHPADELDDAIDALFGATDDADAGWFDVGLVLLGTAIVVSSWIAGLPAFWAAIGVAAIALGVALPLRTIAARARDGRDDGRRSQALGDGQPLDASDRHIARLIAAYERCLEAARLPLAPHGDEAVDAAHAAVVEVATLLGGRAPDGPAETTYVQTRSSAIDARAGDLPRRHRAAIEKRLQVATHAWPPAAVDDAGSRTAALVEARDELIAGTGLGALERMRELRDSFRTEAIDVAS